jgi:SagB-type dehydrogenase family enzyme
MRLKVSESAGLFWDAGRLVWDDYVHHRQYVLTEQGERLCRWFSDWRDPDELGESHGAVRGLVAELLDGGVLIAEGSPQHEAELRRVRAWRDWGSSARHFHYATRTLAATPYATGEEDSLRLRDKAQAEPPPAVCREFRDRPFTPVPDTPAWQSFEKHSLLEVLTGRRTARRFAAGPLELGELGAIVRLAFDSCPGLPFTAAAPGYGTVFKTSPSGGARHPVEAYLHATRVTGLRPGFHHYNPRRQGFEYLGEGWTPDQVARSAGGQLWVSDAAALIYYTAALDRSRWKYDSARSYRVLMMDLGHLSQTVYLAATALGLAVGFTAALRDEPVEDVLGCDPDHEIVLGLTALGHATGLDPARAAIGRTSHTDEK